VRNGPAAYLQNLNTVTILVSGCPLNDQLWLHAPVDILPLPWYGVASPIISCAFQADTRTDWTAYTPPPDAGIHGSAAQDGVTGRCEDLASLLNLGKENWVALIQHDNLAKVFSTRRLQFT
jgi:hypothetical protein